MGTFSNALKASVVLAIVLVGHAGAARVTASLEGDFVCPLQCLECCDSTGLFKASFKCILRDPQDLRTLQLPDVAGYSRGIVEGRECQTPMTRNTWHKTQNTLQDREHNDDDQHPKTHCKYLDSENRATEKKCSSKFICCCSDNQNWNEDRCFAGAQQGTREELADHNDKVELFVMNKSAVLYSRQRILTKKVALNLSASAQLFENMGACRRAGNTHHVYDSTSVPSASESPHVLDRRVTGCCLAIEEKIVNHRRVVMDEGFLWGGTPITLRSSRTYTTCKEHERLHHCSADEGVTASGEFMYKRVPPLVQGTCLGDEQFKMVRDLGPRIFGQKQENCPSDMFAGSWCACNEGAEPAEKGCTEWEFDEQEGKFVNRFRSFQEKWKKQRKKW